MPAARPAPAASPVLPASQASNQDDFLSVDQAFQLAGFPQGRDQVRLIWEIADGYYLYRARIKVAAGGPGLTIKGVAMPQGDIKNDEFFGRQEIYHHQLVAAVSVARASGAPADVPVKVTYQGCATAGLCYPPVTKTLSIHLGAASAGAPGLPVAGAAAAAAAAHPFVSEQDWYARLATSGNLFIMLGGFFLAGLALAFTPCVLPMVPILAGIIAGQKDITTGRAFALSLTYVLGMAFTYTVAGALCAAAGQQVQAVFQQPWILVLFAALFVALALSMFGLFTVQMPAAIQSRIAGISNRQSAGTFGGVAVMGVLSALIVTTCVGPALVGALAVISQTGEVARGAAALFVMSLGMGTPLLAVGASQGKLLPKAGPWMDTVKKLFGVMLLAVAVWMLDRILPGRVALVLWALPAGVAAWLLGTSVRGQSIPAWTGRLAALAAGLYGAALLAGAALGGTDPLAPIPGLTASAHELPFRTIKTVADLDHAVVVAHTQGKPVVLDFYADWCTSCKEMQKYTFTNPAVQAALKGTVLLRADVTANDAADQALLHRFGIFGPPTIAFYSADGVEHPGYRVVGYMNAAAFVARVRRALLPRPGATG